MTLEDFKNLSDGTLLLYRRCIYDGRAATLRFRIGYFINDSNLFHSIDGIDKNGMHAEWPIRHHELYDIITKEQCLLYLLEQ